MNQSKRPALIQNKAGQVAAIPQNQAEVKANKLALAWQKKAETRRHHGLPTFRFSAKKRPPSAMRSSVWYKDEEDAAHRQAELDDQVSEQARLLALEESMQAAKTRVILSQKKGTGKVAVHLPFGDKPFSMGIPELLEVIVHAS
jgi:hypothetical protein